MIYLLILISLPSLSLPDPPQIDYYWPIAAMNEVGEMSGFRLKDPCSERASWELVVKEEARPLWFVNGQESFPLCPPEFRSAFRADS